MPKISIIIPVYNTEKTLDNCLKSVLKQTYDKLEIICVDDGSNDNSLEICKKYEQMDERIIVLSKKNGGPASARNMGLKEATGEFVTFIDSDDWIENNTYEKLVKLISDDVDMLVYGFSKDTDLVVEPMQNIGYIGDEIYSREKLIEYAFCREKYRRFAAYVWNKLFRRSILLKYNICFDEELRRGEDVLFFSVFVSKAGKTIYLDECLYHYIQRNTSLTHVKNASNFEKLADILYAYKKAINHLEKENLNIESLDFMKCFYVYHASLLYEIVEKEGIFERKIYLKNAMQEYLSEYKNCNYMFEERIKRIESFLS